MLEVTVPKPPNPALFTHNNPCTDSEMQSSNDSIAKITATVIGIDAELERLRLANAGMEASHNAIPHSETTIASIKSDQARLSLAKEHLQMVQRQHEAITNSIRHIPNEILSEVMKHCVESDGSYESIHQSLKEVLNFAMVCSRWRETAISTPQLWTRIRWNGTLLDQVVTNVMISRSGDCDLQLINNIPHPSQIPSQLRTSLLESIRLHHKRIDYLEDEHGWMGDVMVIGPAFHHLRTLDCAQYMSIHALLHIFSHSPELVEVRVRLDNTINHPFSDSLNSQTVTMHQLNDLHLSYTTDPTGFLDLITAPRLEAFITFLVEPSVSLPAAQFIKLLQRSNASLKDLCIEYGALSIPDFHRMIDAMPHLDELRLDGFEAELISATYDYLTYRTGHPIILPKLDTLTIRNNGDDMLPHELHAMILSRAQTYPIKKVVLGFLDDGHEFKDEPFLLLRKDAERLGYELEAIDEDGNIVVVND